MQTFKKRCLSWLLGIAVLTGLSPTAWAGDFVDIKLDLTNAALLDSTTDKAPQHFGVTVAEGELVKAAYGAEGNVIDLDGTYWNNHGWSKINATFPVEGNVKVSLGHCQYGAPSSAVLKKGEEVVATFEFPGTRSCWKSGSEDFSSVIYKGDATTLTLESTGGYVPYLAVEAVGEIVDYIVDYKVTFSLGESGAVGTVPAAQTVIEGDSIAIPKNNSLYVEGKTLKAWTDGEKSYAVGKYVVVNADVTLTPVFEANTASLGEAEATVVFDFSKASAGALALQGNKGQIVTQATVGEETIDVLCDIDATSGKLNNAGRSDKWAQCNDGTVLTIPALKGMTVSSDVYNTGNFVYNGDTLATTSVYALSADTTTLSIQTLGIGYLATLTVSYPDTSAAPIEYAEIKFAAGSAEFEGSLPSGVSALVVGTDTYTLPKNYTMYAEGKTLKAWTDGEKSYAPGETIDVEGSVTFTPVFVDNSIELGDAEATVVFDFQKKNIGVVTLQGNKGMVVAQAIFSSDTIDVKCDVDATSGKLNNGSWDDWAQCNNGTVLTIPAIEGMTVAPVANNFTATQGYFVYSGDTLSVDSTYTLTSAKSLLSLTAGNVGYLRTLSVTYPAGKVVEIKYVSVAIEAGDAGFVGLLPEGKGDLVAGSDTYTLPKNFTMYAEGKTLKAWTDGEKSYAPGETIVVEDSLVLTPVFVENAVTLADRTSAVNIKFDFMRQDGAPTVAFQNATGIWVAQAVVNGDTIDVKADFDTNNGGKFANGNWTDWAQLNSGTKFVVPSCKGAVVSMEAYNSLSTTTIDGQKDYTPGNSIAYTVAGDADTVAVVISNDGAYYKYINVKLPYIEPAIGALTDEPALVVWHMLNTATFQTPDEVTPAGSFATSTIDIGDLECTGVGSRTVDPDNGMQFLKFKPSGSTQSISWVLKPVAGLTFTPTKVTGNIQRFATDAEHNVVFSVKVGDGESQTIGTFTSARANHGLDKDKYAKNDDYATSVSMELTEAQQEALASGETFVLSATLGVASSKEVGFSEIKVYGLLNGEPAPVDKYTLSAKANLEEAAEITIYPKNSEYEEGAEVTLTAARNFGYKFINWTDSLGNVVSTDSKFKVTVDSTSAFVANLEKVNTYELALEVEGGANSYMVQPTPAGTTVDGKRMYEDGTEVTLVASNNDILTFGSWSNGQTAAEIKLTMTEDTKLTATYSAIDYIAAWDFYKAGNDGRVADFYAEDNDADQLVLRKEDGSTSAWLDKSQLAAGGYEGRPAAVNWRTTGLGDYYWQTKVNAAAFTDMKVKCAMLYNYNAYTTYDVQYSLDGEAWATIGSIVMEGAKKWTDEEFDVPAEANNKEAVYIRWIADKTSKTDGTTSSNDGATLGAIYITGTAAIVDDGTAPVLISTVPADKATGASASGKVVLTFDEKVIVVDDAKAKIGEDELALTASGKTILAEYKGLEYNTEYSFTLPAGSVADRAGNAIKEDITLSFTTMAKSPVGKQLYDFVVPRDGDLIAAIAAATAREDNTKRFRIFVMKGDYVIPASETATKTGTDGVAYPDPTLYLTTPNVSIIGEDREATSFIHTVPGGLTDNAVAGSGGKANPLEGIRTSGVLEFKAAATNTYMEDITFKSGMADATGRNVVLLDGSNKTICKNVCFWGYQDTYTSDNSNSRFYFEGGVLRGRTDFLCGKGDVYYNGVTLQICEKGGYIAVPSVPTKYGYIFKDCVITPESDDIDGNYTLGRPWGSGTPIALYIDTKMEAQPSAIGWSEMSNGWPAQFAEYNSVTSSGTVIDLSGRKTTFADTHTNNPLLSKENADKLTIQTVMGDGDDWNPTLATEEAPAPADVALDKENGVLSWTGSEYALLYAIVKDGNVIDFTTEETYTVSDTTAVYAVRAANEMGGLGEAVVAEALNVEPTPGQDTEAINVIAADGKAVKAVEVYSLGGQKLAKPSRGLNIIRIIYTDGTTGSSRMLVK